MVFDFKPAPGGGPVMVLFHGLGDDMFSLQKIAELADREGFGILRMDAHGHGKTLETYLQYHHGELPEIFDYRDDVADVIQLIQSLGLKNVLLVGHSRGGGIALKVSQDLPKGIERSVHVMAPYIQRIDKFLADSMRPQNLLLGTTEASLKASGIPEDFINSMLSPFYNFCWNYTTHLRYLQDASSAFWKIDQIKDFLLDPQVDAYMRESYRKYFISKLGQAEGDLSVAELVALSLRVEAAIKATKGVRSLDYLDTTASLDGFPPILQILGGQNDQLVVPKQLQQFAQRLEQWNKPYTLEFLQGPNSQHFFPQMMSEDVYHRILERWTRPKAR